MKLRLTAVLCAAAAVVGGALVGPSAPASATTGTITTTTATTVTPSALPRGTAAHGYLLGRDIHTPTGAVIHLPRTWRTHAGDVPLLELVGKVGRVYFVQRWDRQLYAARLYRVTGSGMSRIDTGSTAGSGTLGWFLSSDNRRIIRATTDGYGGDALVVMDLRGTRIAHHGAGGDGNFNGATSSDVWYTASYAGARTHDWSITAGTAPSIGVSGYLAVPGRDLLFTLPGAGAAPGVTSLSQPGTPRWTAQFRAVAVSPDGTEVIGYQGFSEFPGRVVQIRDLSDGSLVRSFRFPSGGSWGDLWWESDSDVLISFTGRDAWLVRCSTAGVCHRAAHDASGSLDYTHHEVPQWHAEAMS